MKVRIMCLAVTVVTLAGSACATMQLANAPLQKATIELWRDAANRCHTNTTPYFKVKKGRERKVEWKIVDETDCTASLDVEVRFDKPKESPNPDPLPDCVKKNKRKIECDLKNDTPEGAKEYSVWLGDQQEDPVLEIEQF